MFQAMGKELKELFTLYHKGDTSGESLSATEELGLKEEDIETIPTEMINTNIRTSTPI